MKKFLETSERQELLNLHKKERDKRTADRIKVALLYDDGLTLTEIAKVLFIDEASVSRHLGAYLEEQRLTPAHKGSNPMLNSAESAALAAHLEDNLYTKVKEIQVYILKTYSKSLAMTTVYNWLKHNKFTYKKPKLVPANPNIEAQKAFVEEYETLMNQIAFTNDVVLFGDSVHPSQQTRTSYGWVKKGKDRLLEVKSGRKRVNLMGALNLEDMGFVYKDYETINGLSAVDFLKKIEARYPDQDQTIHLIWDGAGYHTCLEVQEYLKTSRIKVHYLPPRSPNLNAIERLWKIMHEHISNNRTYEKFKDFKKALFEFFDSTMGNIKDILVSRITDNFHIPVLAK